ncbi:MAG TPA: hypothetical protein VMR92_07425 [Gemmatimonadales bacterium]|nr:hypothetical protein [Gemmatimonadales bacterium]
MVRYPYVASTAVLWFKGGSTTIERAFAVHREPASIKVAVIP